MLAVSEIVLASILFLAIIYIEVKFLYRKENIAAK
tara:strand:+ start:478 stop:582 length:105 start_codon:yes stop_codon:yes gene_type:complete